MTNIQGYSQDPNDGNVYLCGDYLRDEGVNDVGNAAYSAAVVYISRAGTH